MQTLAVSATSKALFTENQLSMMFGWCTHFEMGYMVSLIVLCIIMDSFLLIIVYKFIKMEYNPKQRVIYYLGIIFSIISFIAIPSQIPYIIYLKCHPWGYGIDHAIVV